MNKMVINPIAVDLGASHTGVYSANYPAGSDARDISRSGKVYTLENNDYTLLMANRTSKRHQRRGADRLQMAKRLFKLIWVKHFNFQWNDDISKNIGFLLNRRGFSFLSEEYDKTILSKFPQAAWQELPQDFTNLLNVKEEDCVDLSGVILEFAEDQKKCRKALDILCLQAKDVKKNLLYFNRTMVLKDYCRLLFEDVSQENIKKKDKKLQKTPLWVINEWISKGTEGLDFLTTDARSVDMVQYLDDNQQQIDKILNTLPEYSEDLKKLKLSLWNFDESRCDPEKLNFTEIEKNDYVKSHIHHLAYALYKINDELESGGRYRKKYFDEIENILNKNNHTHGYLKNFCSSLQNREYSGLTPTELKNLIGHISNLELKPLRKYFNNKGHMKGDFWDESKLKKYFENWCSFSNYSDLSLTR